MQTFWLQNDPDITSTSEASHISKLPTHLRELSDGNDHVVNVATDNLVLMSLALVTAACASTDASTLAATSYQKLNASL